MRNVVWLEDGKIAAWDNDDGTKGSGTIENPELKEWLKSNTPAPVVVVPAPTVDQVYDLLLQQQQLVKAVVLALNDGTLTVGANRTNAQLKNIIKVKL